MITILITITIMEKIVNTYIKIIKTKINHRTHINNRNSTRKSHDLRIDQILGFPQWLMDVPWAPFHLAFWTPSAGFLNHSQLHPSSIILFWFPYFFIIIIIMIIMIIMIIIIIIIIIILLGPVLPVFFSTLFALYLVSFIFVHLPLRQLLRPSLQD